MSESALTGRRIWVRCWRGGDAISLAQPGNLLLKVLVLPDEFLEGLVAVLLALELFYLPFESFDVFLCPRTNGPLCFSVVCPLPSQLGRRQSRDATSTYFETT